MGTGREAEGVKEGKSEKARRRARVKSGKGLEEDGGSEKKAVEIYIRGREGERG